MRSLLAVAGFTLVGLSTHSQTLIINEVSQGVSGSKEYMEFVVVDTAAFYDCTGSAPPCIDIRGWIFDDNNGYHGPDGIASGAVRFSFDPLWSCIELGTIVVVYNNADPNPEMPPDDLSTADGNCTLIVPINDINLFENNTTTPGDVACSYPAVGWTAGGNWSSTFFANGGDCARLVDLAGCEVFSVCWGTDDLNTQVYFSGGATSSTSATNTVYFFNNGDPTNSSNWTIGCADVPACGVEDQTPGVANNADNADYIAQFNNGCAPIPPLVAAAVPTSSCTCNGSAAASGSGSIPGYTYEWYDVTFTPIGQSTDTATALCNGTYNVIVTSSIGCVDTATVIISNTPGPTAGTLGALTVCNNDAVINLIDSLGASPDPGGAWTGPSGLAGGDLGTFDPATNTAGVYTYTVGTAPCDSSATVTVTVNTLPNAGIPSTIAVCSTGGTIDLLDSLGGSADGGGSWTGPTALAGGDLGTFDPGTNTAGVYSYTVNGTAPCPDSVATVTITITTPPDPGIDGTATFCINGGSVDLLDSLGGTPDLTGSWSPALTSGTGLFDPSVDGSGVYTYTVPGTAPCPDLSATVTVTVISTNDASINPAGPLCVFGAAVTLTPATAGGVWSASCGNCIDAVTGDFDPVVAGVGSHTISYTTAGICGATESIVIDVTVPTAGFTATPTSGPAPLTVDFTNSSVGGSNYQWTFGDGNSSTSTDPQNTFNNNGSFIVTLVVTDAAGCTDTAVATILVDLGLFIPNAFSPDNDGFNEFFVIDGLEAFPDNSLKIVNRWGDEVYGASPYLNDWDGTSNNSALRIFGEKVVDGTYFYFLKLDEGTEFHGFLLKKTQ